MGGTAVQAGNLREQKDTKGKVIVQLQGYKSVVGQKRTICHFLHCEDEGIKKAMKWQDQNKPQGNDSAPKQIIRLGSCQVQDVANA